MNPVVITFVCYTFNIVSFRVLIVLVVFLTSFKDKYTKEKDFLMSSVKIIMFYLKKNFGYN